MVLCKTHAQIYSYILSRDERMNTNACAIYKHVIHVSINVRELVYRTSFMEIIVDTA